MSFPPLSRFLLLLHFSIDVVGFRQLFEQCHFDGHAHISTRLKRTCCGDQDDLQQICVRSADDMTTRSGDHSEGRFETDLENTGQTSRSCSVLS